MKVISEFIVHVFDLVEAEGRSLATIIGDGAHRARCAARTAALGGVLLLISIPLLLGGCWLMAYGLREWLEPLIGRPMSAGLTGLAVLAAGAACLLVCFRMLTPRRLP